MVDVPLTYVGRSVEGSVKAIVLDSSAPHGLEADDLGAHKEFHATEMAKLIPARTEREELEEDENRPEEGSAGEMTDWLKEWHGESPKIEIKDEKTEEKTRRQTSELERSRGGDFEQSFLKATTEHHGEAIAMAATGTTRVSGPRGCPCFIPGRV